MKYPLLFSLASLESPSSSAASVGLVTLASWKNSPRISEAMVSNLGSAGRTPSTTTTHWDRDGPFRHSKKHWRSWTWAPSIGRQTSCIALLTAIHKPWKKEHSLFCLILTLLIP